jgi:hypothetical protein
LLALAKSAEIERDYRELKDARKARSLKGRTTENVLEVTRAVPAASLMG